MVIQKAYQARLEELAAERDQRAGEARSAQTRFQTAMKQISRQQTALLQSVEQRRELTTALDLMRQRLQDAVSQRDAVTAANDRLLAQMNDVSEKLSARPAPTSTETLKTVSGALSEAVAARDAATAERDGPDASSWPTSSSDARSTPSARTRWSTSSSRRSPCPSGRWRS